MNGIETIGHWPSMIKAGLNDALKVSMDVCGRNGEQACRHAMILMAESARKLTRKAPKNRPVLHDERLANDPYVETYPKGGGGPVRVHKFRFSKTIDPSSRLAGTWEQAKRIKNAGLAKRSWMWSLGRIGGHPESVPIAGVSRLYTILSEKVCGYIKNNNLSYILKAMPAGWDSLVESRVANKIMAQGRDKLQRQWQREMGIFNYKTGRKLGSRTLADYFLRGAA